MVDEKVTSLGIRVVCDEETLRNFASSFLSVGRRSVKIFEDLNTLTSGSCAHIESGVTRFDVEEERRDHRDCFLSGDVAGISLVNEEVLELLESVDLAKS